MKEASREGPIDPSSSPYDGPAFLSTSAHADSPTGAQDIIVTSASSRMPRATISLLLLGMRRGRASRARTKAPSPMDHVSRSRRDDERVRVRGVGDRRAAACREERGRTWDGGRGVPDRYESEARAPRRRPARAPPVCAVRGAARADRGHPEISVSTSAKSSRPPMLAAAHTASHTRPVIAGGRGVRPNRRHERHIRARTWVLARALS